MDQSEKNEESPNSQPEPIVELVDDEPPPEKEKQVVINEDVQVFVITPDSTEVTLLPVPSKLHTKGDKETVNFDKIISATTDILDSHLKRCMEMKSTGQKRLYILYRVRQSVQLYADHLEKLKNFFFQHDQVQSEWYVKFCNRLPTYGDYLKALDHHQGPVEVEGVPHAVSQTEVRKLVKGVADSVYDGGKFVLSQRALCKTIDHDVRNKLFTDYVDPLTQRSALLKKIDEDQQIIREMLSDLNAYVNFLKLDQLEPIIADFKLNIDFKIL